MIKNPLIRPAISWGKRGIGWVPLDFHEQSMGLIHPMVACQTASKSWQLYPMTDPCMLYLHTNLT